MRAFDAESHRRDYQAAMRAAEIALRDTVERFLPLVRKGPYTLADLSDADKALCIAVYLRVCEANRLTRDVAWEYCTEAVVDKMPDALLNLLEGRDDAAHELTQVYMKGCLSYGEGRLKAVIDEINERRRAA